MRLVALLSVTGSAGLLGLAATAYVVAVSGPTSEGHRVAVPRAPHWRRDCSRPRCAS
ncbi:hypothetical protein [Streptomyces sp. NPDC048361]|uniref:hypothetical protein n=1 Tax=Streptomyces sp. NPDC048361 TaxID=3154720 RepID=UPI003430F896